VSAGAFAVIHLIDPNAAFAVPSLFVIGVALGWSALRYGDLSVPILVHAGVNLSGAVVLIYGDEIQEWADSVEAVLTIL
jgi:membrane protease YdiL (CAAX protease family)